MRCARASLAVLLLMPMALRAQPAPEALVIGNGSYAALPALSACLLSSHAVSAALRALGFQIVEREDVSSGGADAAIGEFAQALSDNPGAAAFVYTCGYATSFNDRIFLLPISARIARPADVLTQGVLVKSLVDAIARSGAGAAFVAVEAIPTEDSRTAPRFDSLAQAGLPDSLGLIVASQPKAPDAPTPLATALIASLKGTQVQTMSLLADLQQRLGGSSAVTLSFVHPPVTAGYLAGAPRPVPAPTPAVAPIPPGPQAALPSDEQMTDVDRRRSQTALARLGYYDGKIDGIFGPDSRAAIRRYQHELGAAMTGRLTATQASRLIAGQ
jgi:putative peptidoglycan binding protein/caspase domain-containing protein